MEKISLIRDMLLNEMKSSTKAEIIILIFSEVNEDRIIKKCVNFRYVKDMISKTSYYDGIKKLKSKGIILEDEIISIEEEDEEEARDSQSEQKCQNSDKQKGEVGKEIIKYVNIFIC